MNEASRWSLREAWDGRGWGVGGERSAQESGRGGGAAAGALRVRKLADRGYFQSGICSVQKGISGLQ